MHPIRTLAALAALSAAALLAACSADDGDNGATGPAGPAGAAGADGAPGADATRNTIALTFIGRARNPASLFDQSAAEVVAYDAASQQLFVVNAQSGSVDLFSIAAPSAPTLTGSLDVAADVAAAVPAVAAAADLGAANSVAVDPLSNTVAIAIEADPKQNPGYVAFYQASDGAFLSAVQVGALPDMLTYTPDGSKVIVANEGEPSDDYTVDPEGSVSIIDVSGGAAAVTDANVTQVTFGAFTAAALRADGVRVFGPGATGAQDLEPEYVAVDPDSSRAFVSLQENNAVAEIDLAAGTVTAIRALGLKDHRLPGNGFDASNRDDIVNIRAWPVFGVYLPDAIAAYDFNGQTYVVTANEGDSRDYGGFSEEIRIGDLTAAQIDLPLADIQSYLADFNGDGMVTVDDALENEGLGRLKITTSNSLTACDGSDETLCSFDELWAYGGRSISIFNADTDELVFDSGDEIERVTAERLGIADFNSTNDENRTGDDRSDDKGPEPEGVTLATIDGRTYAFVVLERVGGVMLYDISIPEDTKFVQYLNTRDFDIADVADPTVADDIDLGPESSVFIPAADSPTGVALLVVANEVSGTITVLEVASVAVGG